MGNKKKTRPIGFIKYVSDVIKTRLDQLGITRYRFVMDNPDIATHPVLGHLIHGDRAVNSKTLYDYLDRLGLEMVFLSKDRPQEECLTVEQTARLYELGFDTQGILHPTVGDLMRWLPKSIDYEQDLFLSYDSVEEEWVAGYQDTDNCFSSDKLIEALYQLLVWAIENELVKTKNINQDED